MHERCPVPRRPSPAYPERGRDLYDPLAASLRRAAAPGVGWHRAQMAPARSRAVPRRLGALLLGDQGPGLGEPGVVPMGRAGMPQGQRPQIVRAGADVIGLELVAFGLDHPAGLGQPAG